MMSFLIGQITIDIAADSWWATALSSLGPLFIFVVVLALVNIYVVQKISKKDTRMPLTYILNILILLSGVAGVSLFMLMKLKEIGVL